MKVIRFLLIAVIVFSLGVAVGCSSDGSSSPASPTFDNNTSGGGPGGDF